MELSFKWGMFFVSSQYFFPCFYKRIRSLWLKCLKTNGNSSVNSRQHTAVAVQGNTVYIGKGLRINVLDVSDPANPLLMGMSDTFSDMILDIAIEGNTAFVAAGKAGLQIVDIADLPNQN